MQQEKELNELATATWRLEKWINNLNVERKMPAKSALRSINKYLKENKIEIQDLTGQKFDVGLAVSVVNNESEEKDENKLIISEMVKPIITSEGAVIQYGQVILGDTIKQAKIINEDNKNPLEDNNESKKDLDTMNKVNNNLNKEENNHKNNIYNYFIFLFIQIILLVIFVFFQKKTMKNTLK